MPTTYAIPNGRTVMDATLYTGDGTNGRTITNQDNGTVGFKPDLVWIKSRSNALNNNLYDSNRGAPLELCSNNNAADSSGDLTAFATNGFTINQTAGYEINHSGYTYVSWQWQAGQGTNTSNTSGSITSTVSVNATAGFSVVTYTGTGSNATVGHGLGAVPQMIIVKNRSTTGSWQVYHASVGNTSSMQLNSNVAASASSTWWQNTTPTSSVFSIGTDTTVNGSTNNLVAYCWTPVAGFSQFGSYTGNGSADGPFVYCGFRPKYILFKRSSGAGVVGDWNMLDSSRSPYNVVMNSLYADLNIAEETSVTWLDFLSNGFKIRYAGGSGVNANGETYVYACFAENPFKYANAR